MSGNDQQTNHLVPCREDAYAHLEMAQNNRLLMQSKACLRNLKRYLRSFPRVKMKIDPW
jgi:hypothetical protein